ncbi:MlaD family protein [Sulfurovum sp.]|jgi:phospholipid/cholesterol/gamma-HCH transport system substrate-binding protein|uniref:MlaD family protein n=1 Tax=Sulfurovum sp. TaxID=1969726 RepID=UPI002A3653CD|nr:MlaD family protein [Sulfurovum sp.]MDY0403445.1 MlaD family protein [Sulfurovum sp.]
MYSRVNYLVVGIFVILFGIGLVWFAFWLGKYDLRDQYHTYKLEISESVSGLSVDSDVMLRGVDIGRVSAIRINPDNIEVTEVYVNIRQDVPIKEDMVATTKMFGITGLLSIEIEGGTNAAKTLQPTDEYIPTIKTKTSLVANLGRSVESLSQKLDALLEQGQKVVSDKNINTVEKILDNVEVITKNGEEVEKRLMSSLEELDTAIKAFRDSMQRVSTNFEGATKDLNDVKKVIVPTIENFNRVTLKVEQSLDRDDYNMKKILEPLIVDMQILSSQMSDLAGELEESPSNLIFKSRTPLKGPGE